MRGKRKMGKRDRGEVNLRNGAAELREGLRGAREKQRQQAMQQGWGTIFLERKFLVLHGRAVFEYNQ